MKNLSLVIDEIIGKPFKQHGRGPEEFDCWGVALYCCARLGVYLPDPFSAKAGTLRQYLFGPSPAAPSPLDLFFFATRVSSHVALVEDAKWVVTADVGLGVHRGRVSDYTSSAKLYRINRPCLQSIT